VAGFDVADLVGALALVAIAWVALKAWAEGA
jgi:hypothetical protein